MTELKRQAFEANVRLPKTGLIDLTFGNVSVIDRGKGILAIKPSGVSYESMTPGDMVLVDLEGKTLENGLNPSSDTPTHVCLFRQFKTIGAIAHTHSRFATAFAQAGRSVPAYGTTHADSAPGEIPLTRDLTPDEIEGAYEWNTGTVIVEAFRDKDPLHFPGILVKNHGPFTWGTSGDAAIDNALILERVAEMALYTERINPDVRPISQTLLTKHFQRKHGANAYYGQG